MLHFLQQCSCPGIHQGSCGTGRALASTDSYIVHNPDEEADTLFDVLDNILSGFSSPTPRSLTIHRALHFLRTDAESASQRAQAAPRPQGG